MQLRTIRPLYLRQSVLLHGNQQAQGLHVLSMSRPARGHRALLAPYGRSRQITAGSSLLAHRRHPSRRGPQGIGLESQLLALPLLSSLLQQLTRSILYWKPSGSPPAVNAFCGRAIGPIKSNSQHSLMVMPQISVT